MLEAEVSFEEGPGAVLGLIPASSSPVQIPQSTSDFSAARIKHCDKTANKKVCLNLMISEVKSTTARDCGIVQQAQQQNVFNHIYKQREQTASGVRDCDFSRLHHSQ